MQSIRCTDFGESEVVDIERPTPGEDEVLVEIERVQLSVTECQIYQGHEIGSYEAVAETMHEGDGRVFGHEFCGRIAEAGDGVEELAVGDRVYAPAKIACGSCS
jgi:threonine dehydrogenase-like Zn-dependent dehydrogenase